MELTGEQRIAASRSMVWQALNDPATLRAAIPGCETLEQKAANEFTATVMAAVGPVKARFTGAVTLSDIDPPNGYTLIGEGKGGAAGFAKGEARVTLTDDGDGTRLHYQVKAHVGGQLARIGSRLIDAAAKKLADEFFANFRAAVEAPAALPEAPPAPQRAGGLVPIIWGGALILLTLVFLWYLTRLS
ncbi:MAG: SRPBCC family protein [Pseudomonadota bacterium]